VPPADDDLDQLVSELNRGVLPAPVGMGPPAVVPAPPQPSPSARAPAADPAVTPLAEWLARVRAAEGSDLLLVAGAPPTMRAAGRLVRLSADPLGGDDIEAATMPMVVPRLQARYRDGEAIDL